MSPTRQIGPLLLQPIDTKKSWGSEVWLNPARKDASVRVANAEGTPLLADLIAAQPELLGPWSRALFGDTLPIFTKFLRTNFPPFVHVGFRRDVSADELLGWLDREQSLLRQLLGMLQIPTRARFDEFSNIYSAWATQQAQSAWRPHPAAGLVAQLDTFIAPADRARVTDWFTQLQENRAALVDTLNEVDLRREDGNLLVTSAGIMHAIFGLSHQTHPLDESRVTLSKLYAEFARQAGASDAALLTLIDGSGLAAIRARRQAEPKNEAWYPTTAGGALTLVEPQQSSDTTYSLADFYTPFVWEGHKVRFRKGDAVEGLTDEKLREFVANLDLKATPLAQLRHAPVRVDAGSTTGAQLFCLVDDGVAWPFFTVYKLELAGDKTAPANWRGDHGDGLFQQIVLVAGTCTITGADGRDSTLSPEEPAFIPATMSGGYTLAATERVTLLLFSVPGPRKNIRYAQPR